MKKIISTLFFVAGLVTFGFAQETNDIAVSEGATELVASKTSGVYEFTLPSNVTKDQVEASAKYYTSVFTVEFDEASHKATITMIKNEVKDRYVINRLLTSLQVRHVQVGEESLELHEFVDAYLK